jgi:cobalamin biosynthesis Mg chelatase CobN
MGNEDHTKQTGETPRSKFPVWALILGLLFVIALVGSIFFVGMLSSNPWGDTVGPGP